MTAIRKLKLAYERPSERVFGSREFIARRGDLMPYRIHLCSFVQGVYDVRSPSGKQGLIFEDSNQFGPSKLDLRTGEPSPIYERLRWFWDWYPRWLKAGRPTTGERSTPYGTIKLASGDVE